MPAREPPLDLPGYDDDGRTSPRGVTLVHWLRLAVGAAWRRKVLAVAVFLLGMAAAVAYYRTRTPVYRVQAKILAQRPQALPAVVRPLFDDAPTRSAWELIHRRENLIALIRQTNLLPEPGGGPARPDLREWLTRTMAQGKGAALTEIDPLDALVLIRVA